MNILFFLHPKADIKYIHDDNSVRQGLEKMKAHRFTAIPVIDRDGLYVGTVSEGDFLWHVLNSGKASLRSQEKACIREIMQTDRYPAVRVDATMRDLINRAMDQNFVPVVDDRGVFMGIITRKDIIKYLTDDEGDIK